MTPQEWATIRYFSADEFDSHDAPGSGAEAMQLSIVSRLDALRERWGAPLYITSGYRTPARNALVGGARRSAHMRGLAADIDTKGMRMTISLAILAAQMGFTRIGVDLKGELLHLDCDTALPDGVWFYA